MNNIVKKSVLLAFIFAFSFGLNAQVQKVEVVKQGEKWTFLRNGKPYYVKGAGGETHLDKLVEIGGNSIRTWGAENAGEVLDEAHKRGLTVMLGLWVQHERHGFDYDDKNAVKKQLHGFTKVVHQFKDHPALLLWGVGNEVDLNYSNTKVWDAVQDIAKMIHEVDPNHPTTTVTAGLDKAEVELIMAKAPDIDIYSINTYGDIKNVDTDLKKFGWEGSYMITEWGPNGHWESPTTNWGIPIEQTSKEKADSYQIRLNDHILQKKERCIGSYVFLWGQKQETTATWYGLFSVDGESSEAIDQLYIGWQGKLPANSAPRLDSILVDAKRAKDNIYLNAEKLYQAKAFVSDIDGDKIKYKWQVLPESTDKKSGGDKEDAPIPVSGSIKKNKEGNLEFRAPRKEGSYRLMIYAYDGENHFAAANVPFYVIPRAANAPQSRLVQFKKHELEVPERK